MDNPQDELLKVDPALDTAYPYEYMPASEAAKMREQQNREAIDRAPRASGATRRAGRQLSRPHNRVWEPRRNMSSAHDPMTPQDKDSTVSEAIGTSRKRAYFRFPLGYDEMSPEEQDAFLDAIATNIEGVPSSR